MEQDPVQDFCELIVKYNDHDRAVKVEGEFPNISGTIIEKNLVKGLDPRVAEDPIKQIYKRLALITHPDKGGNEKDFKQNNNAYEKLKNSPSSIQDVFSNLLGDKKPPREMSAPIQRQAPARDLYEWQPSFDPYLKKKRGADKSFSEKITPDEPINVGDESKSNKPSSLNKDSAMNLFIYEYFNFYKKNPSKGETFGEIEPYLYAKRMVEIIFRGFTVLPFDGVGEEMFNDHVKNFVLHTTPILDGDKTNYSIPNVNSSVLREFIIHFEIVNSYNAIRPPTETEIRIAMAKIDDNISWRREINQVKRPSTGSNFKRAYVSSVLGPQKKIGGSKTKRKRNRTNTKRKRDKQKQSRKTRR